MPKVYEYLGVVFKFWSNEHAPIHYHVIYKQHELIVSFFFKDGNLYRITYKDVHGDFPAKKLKDVKDFVKNKKADMCNAWISFFITQKKNNNQILTTMKITNVEYLEDFKLLITFSNNKKQVVDFKPFFEKNQNPMNTQFYNKKSFKRFSLKDGVLFWMGKYGEMDFDANHLPLKN